MTQVTQFSEISMRAPEGETSHLLCVEKRRFQVQVAAVLHGRGHAICTLVPGYVRRALGVGNPLAEMPPKTLGQRGTDPVSPTN